jgi:hypothetical protein
MLHLLKIKFKSVAQLTTSLENQQGFKVIAFIPTLLNIKVDISINTKK